MSRSWDTTHDPFARPLGCNGKYGPGGANRHYYKGEEPCADCRASAAHYRREYRRGGIRPRQLKPCGTPAAAVRHRLKGEPLCFACKVAQANQQAEIRSRRPVVTLPSKGPYSPFSPGRRTLIARTCLGCGELADGDSFPLLNKGKQNQARRRLCHKCFNLKKKRDREERGIGVPAPRPPVELQTSKYTLWSAEDDQRMRDLVAAGDSYENIAVVLGRSLRSVYKRRSDLGLANVRKKHRVEKPWKLQPSPRIAEEIPK